MLQASIVASEALQGSVTPIALADEPPFFMRIISEQIHRLRSG